MHFAYQKFLSISMNYMKNLYVRDIYIFAQIRHNKKSLKERKETKLEIEKSVW